MANPPPARTLRERPAASVFGQQNDICDVAGRLMKRHAGIVFVVDDLGGWLVGLVADAAAKRLVTLVFGSDLDRALRKAANDCVEQTLDELDLAGDEQAERLAKSIGKAFKKPVPSQLAEDATLLQALQAAIADKLAAVEDSARSGAEPSLAELAGVPASVLADKLAGHLVQQIMLRGVQGGPLTPLAEQLNHDATHLQLAELTSEVRKALARTGGAATVVSEAVRLLPRPASLADREELLADLDARLIADSADEPRVAALYGLGGTGKTSVALEYAYQNLDRLEVAWQLAAEDPAALAAGFGDLAVQLGARDSLAAGDAIAQVHGVLAARPGDWLLIFDNAPGPGNLLGKLPPKGRGRVIITSQNPQWPGVQAMEVPVLDLDVAAAFLQARTGSADTDAARELAAELGGLPLALEQAAAYMETTRRDIGWYLTMFRQRRTDLLARGEAAGYGKNVATAWALAFDQLQQSTPAAVSLLRLLACYAPEQIPFRLLLRPQPGLSASLPAEIAPLLDDSLACDDAVAALRQFSLIGPPQDDLVSVHRLVQAVTLGQLPADQATAWRQAARFLIETSLPGNPQQPGTWPAYALLLPHALATIPADDDSMTRFADFLGFSGNYTAGCALYRQILKAQERLLGPEDHDILATRMKLARWIGQAGDAAAARDEYASLLPVAVRVLGAEHPDTLTARSNLALFTGQAGDAAVARDQYATLLPVAERVLGTEHPDTLSVRGNVAYWTGQAGDAATARDQYAALLPVAERVLGAEHPQTLIVRSNLALFTGQAGDAAVARDQYATLLPVAERVLGTEHPDTLSVRGNVAYWTGQAGDAATARDQYAALLPVAERVLGAEHPDTLGVRSNLAMFTGQAGDAAAARDQYATLLPIEERHFGAEHPETLSIRSNLANFTGQAGDAAAARDQYAALLPVQERALGTQHPQTLITRSSLANFTGQAGDAAAARDQYAALLPIEEQVLGTQHPQTLIARANMAHMTGEAGDAAAARDQYATLLPIAERVLGTQHSTTLAVRAELAQWTRKAEQQR
jgi:Tetratricopeptide repeat